MAVSEAFGEFIATGTATAVQIEFIDMVIEHLVDQGVMDPALLYEAPFTDIAPTGPDHLFGEERVTQLSVRLTNSMHREIQSLLECDPHTSPGAPNNPATFLCPAEKQFKSIAQLGLPAYLQAGPTRGIVDNIAINNGILRANDQFGRTGTPACRSNASKPSRIHDTPPGCDPEI